MNLSKDITSKPLTPLEQELFQDTTDRAIKRLQADAASIFTGQLAKGKTPQDVIDAVSELASKLRSGEVVVNLVEGKLELEPSLALQANAKRAVYIDRFHCHMQQHLTQHTASHWSRSSSSAAWELRTLISDPTKASLICEDPKATKSLQGLVLRRILENLEVTQGQTYKEAIRNDSEAAHEPFNEVGFQIIVGIGQTLSKPISNAQAKQLVHEAWRQAVDESKCEPPLPAIEDLNFENLFARV